MEESQSHDITMPLAAQPAVTILAYDSSLSTGEETGTTHDSLGTVPLSTQPSAPPSSLAAQPASTGEASVNDGNDVNDTSGSWPHNVQKPADTSA